MLDIIGNRTIKSVLGERVKQYPDKPFLIFEDKNEYEYTLTYREFQEKVNRLSNGLMELNVKKGDKVTLHLPNSLEFFITWFALAQIGAVMVPTNILSTESEMEYILSHSESVMLITEKEYVTKFTEIKKRLPKLRNVLLSRYDGNQYRTNDLNILMEQSDTSSPTVPLNSQDVAAMLYTSGTTSKPKGVLITHANYLFTGEVMSKSIRLSPDDRQFIVLPLFHANAQYYSTMSAFVVGASIAVTEKFSASRYFKQAKKLGATVGSLFAAPIRMILNQPYDKTDKENNLRLIWFAQQLTDEQLTTFETKFDTKLLHLYGMTETIGAPLMNPLNGIRNNRSIGKPTIGYELKIVDENGRKVNKNEVGQLAVKGEPGRTLMKEYFNNELATNETLQNGWLYTGDNVKVDDDGYFYFIDREKDMIKRSGENIAANEIESVIDKHPSIYESAVIGLPDEIRDETIKAYIIIHEGMTVKEKELRTFCEKHLAKFKVPEFFEFIDDFPRTSVGKVQKHILRQRALQNKTQ